MCRWCKVRAWTSLMSSSHCAAEILTFLMNLKCCIIAASTQSSSNCGPNNQKNISFSSLFLSSNLSCFMLVVFCLTVSCLCFSADLKEAHLRRSEEHKRSSAQMWHTTCCTHFTMVFWLLALWGEHWHTLVYRSHFRGKWIHQWLSLFHFLFCGFFGWSYPLDGQIFPCCWAHTTPWVFEVYTLSGPLNLISGGTN